MIKNVIKHIIIILIFANSYLLADEIKIRIISKVEDQIITNYDILKEVNYLKALNKKLGNLDTIEEDELKQFAKNSLVNEKVKKIEIEKFYKLNYESDITDIIIRDLIKKNNFKNYDEFIDTINSYNLDIKEVRKKLLIEQTWNRLIFELYNEKIVLDENKIQEILNKIIDQNKSQKEYNLSEIVFLGKNETEFIKNYKRIKDSIKNNGFEQSANLYSISNTSKVGGLIGWINENQLSNKINLILDKLSPGEYSKPINTAGGNLILKINEIKNVKVENFNKKEILEKIKISEKNKLLNEYSIIYFNKLKNNININEF